MWYMKTSKIKEDRCSSGLPMKHEGSYIEGTYCNQTHYMNHGLHLKIRKKKKLVKDVWETIQVIEIWALFTYY